jgi:putative transcriptional regulator
MIYMSLHYRHLCIYNMHMMEQIEFLELTNEIYDRISENVKKYRKEKNMSQLELALRIGMTSNAFIARAERRVNNTHFSIKHLVDISLALEIDIIKFFE